MVAGTERQGRHQGKSESCRAREGERSVSTAQKLQCTNFVFKHILGNMKFRSMLPHDRLVVQNKGYLI